jgi:hypothetical protein
MKESQEFASPEDIGCPVERCGRKAFVEPRFSAEFSTCRTRDAIHLATALQFRPIVEGSLEIVTLDTRMRRVAGKLRFEVRPLE